MKESCIRKLICRNVAFAALLTLFILFLVNVSVFAQADSLIPGLTLEYLEKYRDGFSTGCVVITNSKEHKEFTALLARLDSLPVKPTLRVVFQEETKPEAYKCALQEIRRRNFKIMGMFLDSYALSRYRIKRDPSVPDYDANETKTRKDLPDDQRLHDYKKRIDSYLEAFYDSVDIWEVGNEVNGEWADENCNKDPKKSDGGCRNIHPTPNSTAATIEKINYAIRRVKEGNLATSNNKQTALTLVYQPGCNEWSENAMFTWLSNAKASLNLANVNFLLVSYYEDKKCDKNGRNTVCDKKFFERQHEQFERDFCREALNVKEKDSQKLRQFYWNGFFDYLHDQTNVGNIKFGFGEVGCRKESGCSSETDLLDRYYRIRVSRDWFVGGYFWWSAQPDILSGGNFYNSLHTRFKDFQ